jgi:hypothetical protein
VITIILGAIGTISKSFRKYLSDIRGQHIKELQKTFVLGTRHMLQEGTNVKIHNFYYGK